MNSRRTKLYDEGEGDKLGLCSEASRNASCGRKLDSRAKKAVKVPTSGSAI